MKSSKEAWEKLKPEKVHLNNFKSDYKKNIFNQVLVGIKNELFAKK